MRKTKIICTIGPKSEDSEMIEKLMLSGMDGARINFSHGGFEKQAYKVKKIKEVRDKLKLPIPLILDTKGPEIRIGDFEDDEVFLEKGDKFALVTDNILGNKYEIEISYKELYKELKPGDKLLIDDGLIECEVVTIKHKKIFCKVLNGGKLINKKSINIPGKKLKLPGLTDRDIDDIINGINADFDYIAASFIRNPDDVLKIRKLLDDNGGEKIKIISKIENQEGVDNFEKILAVSDGIMVARGDLSVEIPMEKVPMLQKKFIKETYKAGKIVITATQMLESMMTNPRPTRAEVSDVSNAVYDTSSCIMLSGETATGNFPIECAKMMDKIALETEKSIDYWENFKNNVFNEDKKQYRFDLYHGIVDTAMKVDAKAIIAYTDTGNTANVLAAFCPECPIYAVTGDAKTARQLNIVRNVYPILIKQKRNADHMIQYAIEELKIKKQLIEGDTIVIAGGAEIIPKFENNELNKVIGGILTL